MHENANPIVVNIKFSIKNTENIKHIDYVGILLKKIGVLIERQKERIIKILEKYYDKDVCNLIYVPEPLLLVLDDIDIQLDKDVVAKMYVNTDSLDNSIVLDDLLISERLVKIYKNDNVIESGKLYIVMIGWNIECGVWKVKDLLKDRGNTLEIGVVYVPNSKI